MVERRSKRTQSELYELAALGIEHGLTEAVRWLMREMHRSDSSASGGRRKRTVQLVDDTGKPVRAGRFKVPEDVLKRAEVLEIGDA